jgi:transposase-like protein
MAGPKQQIFGQMLSDQLEPNRRAMLGEAAVHRKSRHPSQIEGAV